MKRNKKGFTLAELLVVIAIIAVLTAIAIPVFTTQTKKAQESVEVANARACYAEGMVAVAGGDYKAAIVKPYGDKTYTFTYTEGTPGTWTVGVAKATGGTTDVYHETYGNGGVEFGKVVVDGDPAT